MAVSDCRVERDAILKKLYSDKDEDKLQALAYLSEIGASGGASSTFAQDVAALVRKGSDDVQICAMEALASMGEIGAKFAESISIHLQSFSEQKRASAIWALGMMETHAAKYADDVAQHLKDPSAEVRAASCLALGGMRANKFINEMARLLSDNSPDVVHDILMSLPMLEPEGSKLYGKDVAAKLSHGRKEVRIAAVHYFAKFIELAPQYTSSICKLLMDEDAGVRQAVATLFTSLKDMSEIEATFMITEANKILSHQDVRFKAAAAMAVGGATTQANVPMDLIRELLDDSTEDISQHINVVAGIEPKAPSAFRIPACAAMSALALLGDEICIPKVVELLGSYNSPPEVRLMAADVLGQLSIIGRTGRAAEEDCTDSLLLAFHCPQAHIRAQSVRSLGLLTRQRHNSNAWIASQPKLLEDLAGKAAECLADKSPLVRAAAVEALGNMGEEGAAFTDAILELIKDRSHVVRASVAKSLASMGVKGQLYASELCRRMHDDGREVKIACIQALADMGARGAAFADEVATLSADEDSGVRVAVLEALAKMGKDAKPFFSTVAQRAEKDELQAVRDTAAKLLAAVP